VPPVSAFDFHCHSKGDFSHLPAKNAAGILTRFPDDLFLQFACATRKLTRKSGIYCPYVYIYERSQTKVWYLFLFCLWSGQLAQVKMRLPCLLCFLCLPIVFLRRPEAQTSCQRWQLGIFAQWSQDTLENVLCLGIQLWGGLLKNLLTAGQAAGSLISIGNILAIGTRSFFFLFWFSYAGLWDNRVRRVIRKRSFVNHSKLISRWRYGKSEALSLKCNYN